MSLIEDLPVSAATGLVLDEVFVPSELRREYSAGPAKMEAANGAIIERGLNDRCVLLPPKRAFDETIEGVHEASYVARFKRESESFKGADPPCGPFDSLDTLTSPQMFDRAMLASGSVLEAAKLVWEGQLRNAFCVISPGGHHAERDKAMGFCFFNHISIAAQYLLDHCGAERIAILDWDVHHGNGTQHIFESDPRVLFCSIHQAGLFPKHSGVRSERGIDLGEGFTMNIPLPAESKREAYKRALDSFSSCVRDFDPQLFFLECGFDACRGDGLGRQLLEPHDFRWMTERVMRMADDTSAKGRIVSVLAGGYNAGNVEKAVVCHLETLIRTLDEA